VVAGDAMQNVEAVRGESGKPALAFVAGAVGGARLQIVRRNVCGRSAAARRQLRHRRRVSLSVVDNEPEDVSRFMAVVREDIREGRLPFSTQVDGFINTPVVEAAISLLVLVQCTSFAVESLPIDVFLRETLMAVEAGVSMVFAAEYFLRWYGKNCTPRYLTNRYMVIDLLAILPAFLSLFAGSINLQFVRLLRVTRIFRLQRMLQREDFNKMFGLPATASETRLRITEIIVTVFSILYVSSALLFEAEVELNPDIDNFFDAFYFTLVTLTTVGFGDVTPVTPLGKFLVSCSILTGVFLIPYQLGRLGETVLGDMNMMGQAFFETCECGTCGTLQHPADSNYCRICGSRLRQPWKY